MWHRGPSNKLQSEKERFSQMSWSGFLSVFKHVIVFHQSSPGKGKRMCLTVAKEFPRNRNSIFSSSQLFKLHFFTCALIRSYETSKTRWRWKANDEENFKFQYWISLYCQRKFLDLCRNREKEAKRELLIRSGIGWIRLGSWKEETFSMCSTFDLEISVKSSVPVEKFFFASTCWHWLKIFHLAILRALFSCLDWLGWVGELSLVRECYTIHNRNEMNFNSHFIPISIQ